MTIPWGDHAPIKNLFEPEWNNIVDGERINLVLDADVWGKTTCLGRTFPGEQVVHISGDIPVEAFGFHRLTLLGVCASKGPSVPCLCIDAACTVMCHPPFHFDDLLDVVEACCGMACSSIGLAHVGFRPVVGVEIQPKLAALHDQVHPLAATILGSVTDPLVWKKVWEASPGAGTLMSGISCQPYSRGGSMGGAFDSRSDTLPGVLQLCHFLQFKVLLLECVVPARTNGFVRQHLRALHEELGFHIHDATYRLEETWASHRFRWWVVASHKSIGQIQLPPMPGGSSLTVRSLLPFVREWPFHELQQLVLTDEEKRLFTLRGESLRKYAVQPDQKLPTALHSWGGQGVPCACECRPSGLSESLLLSKGVYAQLFQVKFCGELTWLHLHPCELAILTGVPPQQPWMVDQRLNLCALGQQASPLQAAWVGSQVLRQLQQLILGASSCIPADCLHSLKALVMSQTKVLYPDIVRQPEELLALHVFLDDAIDPVCMTCRPGLPVGALLVAERTLRNDGMPLVACTHDCSEVLAPSMLLMSGPIRVRPVWIPALTDRTLPSLFGEPGYGSAAMEVEESLCEATQLDAHVCPVDPVDPWSDFLDHSAQMIPMCGEGSHELLNLTCAKLQTCCPPLVISEPARHAVRSQLIPSSVRLSVLANQEHVMADDEMLWHLQRLHLVHGDTSCMLIDPLVVHGLLNADIAVPPVAPPEVVCVLSAVWTTRHWTPCVWKKHGDSLQVLIWECDAVELAFLYPLHSIMCVAMQVSSFTEAVERRSFGLEFCGAASLAHVRSILDLDFQRSTSNATLAQFHDDLRTSFSEALGRSDQAVRPWCWGPGGSDSLQMLIALLQLHGVPSTNSTHRAKLAMQSLGKDQVTKCITGPAPWKSLKQLVNQLRPPFQLVLPEELTAKTTQTKQATTSKRKQTSTKVKGPWTLPTEVDPAKLHIGKGTFCVGNDEPLCHIPLSQVNPLASGIALTTVQEAQHFLTSGQILTKQGLALLILNADGDLPTQLQWQTVRFAATCSANGEPVLLHGVLVQLGQTPVYLFRSKTTVSLPMVDVSCCRVTIFQDQFEGDWVEFTKHPVKHAFSMLPPLQTCRKPSCTCPLWHPTATNDTDAVLDVFRRQFCNQSGRPVSAEKSTQYVAMLRFVRDVEMALLPLSGKGGLYLEPKTEDGLCPSLAYQVVWLANADFTEAQHRAQCEVHSLGIARHGSRYGIRVLAEHFQSVFGSLRPDALFLPPGPRLTWQCGPWPFGVDRKALGKIFQQWNWQARATQPAHSMPEGLMWTVQSIADPPQTVYSLPHGQIVISRADVPTTSAPVRQVVAGPAPTVITDPSVDPLQVADPWGSALAKHALPAPAAPLRPQLQELEERLEQTILAKLPAQNMEVDDQASRIADLEHQLQHLATRQQSLEGVVHSNQAETSKQMQTLQAQMMHQLDHQGKQLQSMFDDQLTRMEKILTGKQSRHE